MTAVLRASIVGALLTLASSPGSAQTGTEDWEHGTTVSAVSGVAFDSSATGILAGGALGWEVTPRVMVEGNLTWFDRGDGANAFNAALKARFGLRRQGTSPFVEGGFGLYRMTCDTSADVPDFYRRRMVSDTAIIAEQTFTDPVFHLGGGINIFVSRHFSLQPAVEALIVTDDGRAYTLGAASFRIVYHFEDHPVTPSRGR